MTQSTVMICTGEDGAECRLDFGGAQRLDWEQPSKVIPHGSLDRLPMQKEAQNGRRDQNNSHENNGCDLSSHGS